MMTVETLWFQSAKSQRPNFGIFFDIDGVIVRGKRLLPHAKEAFQVQIYLH